MPNLPAPSRENFSQKSKYTTALSSESGRRLVEPPLPYEDTAQGIKFLHEEKSTLRKTWTETSSLRGEISNEASRETRYQSSSRITSNEPTFSTSGTKSHSHQQLSQNATAPNVATSAIQPYTRTIEDLNISINQISINVVTLTPAIFLTPDERRLLTRGLTFVPSLTARPSSIFRDFKTFIGTLNTTLVHDNKKKHPFAAKPLYYDRVLDDECSSSSTSAGLRDYIQHTKVYKIMLVQTSTW